MIAIGFVIGFVAACGMIGAARLATRWYDTIEGRE